MTSPIYTPVHFPFRKLEIKRRLASTALYETDWVDITKYVSQWGTFQLSVDDLRVNQFNFSGLNISVKNDYGEFNSESDGQSIFYGYLTRYRTLVKLSAGYTDGSGNQYPTDASQGIFIMDANIDIAPTNNEVKLNCKSIISPFEETRASEIDGITNSITSSQIITLIRDATDGSGNYLFQYFIPGASWEIQSTTSIITAFNTTTVLDNYSVWELMTQLAETENFIITATRFGGLVFRDRTPDDSVSSWSFKGSGYRDPDIIAIKNYSEATDKLYTHVRFKYRPDNTSSSYIDSGFETVVNPLSDAWVFGRRTYEYENDLFTDYASADKSASNIRQEFGNLKNELTIETIFNPTIEIMSRVDVSHHEYSITTENCLWDARVWAADTTTSDPSNVLFWSDETTSTIDFYNKDFKVLSKITDLNRYVTTLKLREV